MEKTRSPSTSVYNKPTRRHIPVKVELNLRPTVCRPVCLGVRHPSGTCNQFRVCYFVAPSLTRGQVCNLLYNCFWALPEQSLLTSLRTHGHILLSHLGLPQPWGPGPCVYIPQEQGGRVIPQGTGFPFCRLLRLAGLSQKTEFFRYTNVGGSIYRRSRCNRWMQPSIRGSCYHVPTQYHYIRNLMKIYGFMTHPVFWTCYKRLWVKEVIEWYEIMANYAHCFSLVGIFRLYTSPCIFWELVDRLLLLLFP
jgi:hypothetical protein